MSDARISTGLPSHPKTKKLMRRLGAAGPWALVCLFLWARDNRSDGDLCGMTDEDIELASDWTGDDGALVAALVSVGFLDGDESSRSIHDWASHQPWSAGADARSQSSKWAALCKRYGRDEAAQRMPEYADRMRLARGSDASRTTAARGPDAPLPSPLPFPSPKQELPPSAGENPPTEPPKTEPPEPPKPPEPDPIFGVGLAFLMAKGVPERSARSFLGLLRKECGSDIVAAGLLTRAEQDDISDPVAWLTKAAKASKSNVAQLSLVPAAPEPVKASHRPLAHTPRG